VRALRLTALATSLVCAVAVPALAKGRDTAPGQVKKQQPAAVCTGDPSTYQALTFSSGGQPANALYVLPAGAPKGIVVFDHGYSHTMYSWIRHMERTAKTLGVIAITPDYRGQTDDFKTKPLPESRGWRVAEGAVDTNTVAQLFDKACFNGKPSHNVLYSVSMGGNTAGLALAAKPQRTGGSPLWDQWVDVEGAANVLETYQGARALAGVNTFAAHAQADIEAEMGGTPEQVPSVYADRTVVNRVADIAASGIKGVVMEHGLADGLVTHDISRQLQAQLVARGVPVDFTMFITHTAGTEPGTTLDGYVPTGQASPFAGHASEASETHDVGNAGFAALADLYAGHPVRCVDRVHDSHGGTNGLDMAGLCS
jgi:hypothetical protein